MANVQKAWWRLAAVGSGQPGPVQVIEAPTGLTGAYLKIEGAAPDTLIEWSVTSGTGPWQAFRTHPAPSAQTDRIPVVKTSHGGRPNWIPADFYKSGQAEFMDPVSHPHIMGITHRTVKSGRFTDPATWDKGEIPGTGSVWAVAAGHILIGDNNSDVIFKDALVEFGGTFYLAKNTDTKWRLDTFMSMSSLALVDPEPSTTQGQVKHQFIWHIQQAPGTSTRGGLMAMGDTTIQGAKKESHLRVGLSPIQVEAGETVPAVKAGATRVYLLGLSQSGWRVGQYMMFGGTQHVPLKSTDPQYSGPKEYFNQYKNKLRVLNKFQFGQEEQRIITAIEGDWAEFAEPLLYDHVGMQGTLPQGQHVVVAPIVGNPSQSIEFRSASAEEDGHLDPTADLTVLQKRGHSMFMRNRADVRYASFKNMARTSTDPSLWVDGLPMSVLASGQSKDLLTASVANGGVPIADPENVLGRYAIHFHGGEGAFLGSDPLHLIGCSAWAPLDAPPVPGWGIVHHMVRLHIEDCFAFNVRGAGFVSERGDELGQWANNLSMFCRGDGDSPEWAHRQETHTNHNGSTGVGFENQSRMIVMHGNIAVSCQHGYLYWAQKSNMRNRTLRDIDMTFKDGLLKGMNGSAMFGYDEGYGHYRAQIPPFIDNEAHACSVGFEVVHRLSSTDWARDQTPMLMQGFHCLNVPRPWTVPQYSNNYYTKGCLWKSSGTSLAPIGVGASLGGVSFGWNFANIHLVNYATQFADSGAGVNYDGFFIDITFEGRGVFTSAPTYTRTGITLEDKWGVMGDAERINDNSGKPRVYKPITAADLPQPYPLAPYGYGGVLPAGYDPVPVGGVPYFILGNGTDGKDLKTTLSAGGGRNTGSVHGMIVDSVGVRRWPDAQSCESSLANMSVKKPINLSKLMPEHLVQRWGCWNDNGVIKARAWFPVADRYTHVKTHFHIDFTITGLDPVFVAAHDLGGPSPMPEWPDKLDVVPAYQRPLMPITRTLAFLSRKRIEAVAGRTLAHDLLASETNIRFTIVGGVDAALFRVQGRQLQWAQNGVQTPGGDNSYDVIVRAMDQWGNSTDEAHQVIVIPNERVSTEITDTFDRADGPLTVRYPDAVALTGSLDAWAVRSNQLGYIGTGPTNHLVSLGSLGSSDQEINIRLSSEGGASSMVFRLVDANNYLSARRVEGGVVAIIVDMTVDGITTELARFPTIRNNTVITVEGRRMVVMDSGTPTNEPISHYPKAGDYKRLAPFEQSAHWQSGAVMLPENAPMGTEVGFRSNAAYAHNSAFDTMRLKALNHAVGGVGT